MASEIPTTKIEAAARAMVDGASGNGSRMTVSKSHYDALVDALREAANGK